MIRLSKKLFALLVLAACALLSVAVIGVGCSDDNAPSGLTDRDYSVSENATIDVGDTFTPVITVRNGASVLSVTLRDGLGAEVTTAADYSFTANQRGIYTYTIVFAKGADRAEVSFTVTARDLVAPVIVSPIADKTQVETGYYDQFAADLATLVVSDNCDSADNLAISVEKISFGEEEFEFDGGDGFFFDREGEYTVSVSVCDTSGNATGTSYKIVTADTVAPEIKGISAPFVWLGDGIISVPVPEVYEVGGYTLSFEVKKGSDSVATDGFTFTADGTGEYEIVYTATDEAGNESDPCSVKLYVVEDGSVSDFSYQEEMDAWQTGDIEKYSEDEKMILYGEGENEISRTVEESDWSAFNLLEIGLENRKADNLVLELYITDKNGRHKIRDLNAAFAVANGEFTGSAAAEDRFTIDLENCGIDRASVTEISFRVLADNPYRFALTGIFLRSGEADYGEKPSDIGQEDIGFETDLNKTQIFNGGSGINTDERYVLSGTRSAVYRLNAGSYCGEYFSEVRVDSAANAIRLYVFSKSDARVQFTGMFGGTELKSGFYLLGPGWNKVEWYVGIENEFTLDQVGLSGLILTSGADYNADFYVDAVSFIVKDAFTDDDVFVNANVFSVPYGEQFAVPSVLAGDGRQTSSIRVALFEGAKTEEELRLEEDYGFTEDNAVELYQRLTFETSGTYTLAYVVTDILGAEHLRVYTVQAEKNVLSFDVTMPLLTDGNEFDLGQVSLTSDVYTQEQLQSATISVYYKKDGNVNWHSLSGNRFTAENTGFYRFKYVAEYEDLHIEEVFREYVHAEGIVADFEVFGDTHHGYGIDYSIQHQIDIGEYEEGKHVYLVTEVSDEWANDGEYSLKYITDMTGWGGFYFTDPIAVEAGSVNGIRITVNASQPARGIRFSLRTDRGWVFSQEIDLQSGVHEYTLKVNYEGENSLTEVAFTEIEAITFFIPYDPTKVYYFDTLSFVSTEADSVV